MNVPVGLASKVGYFLTSLAAAATAWAAAASNPAISPETLLIVTIVAGVVTNLGRQLQATPTAHVLPPITVAPPAGQSASKTVEGP